MKSPASTLVSVKSKAKTGLLFTAMMIGARIAFHVGIRMAVRIGIRTMARVLARGFTRNTLRMAWKAAKKYIRKKGRKMLKKQAKKQFKKCLKRSCGTSGNSLDDEEELYQIAATHSAIMKSSSQTTLTSAASRKLLGGSRRSSGTSDGEKQCLAACFDMGEQVQEDVDTGITNIDTVCFPETGTCSGNGKRVGKGWHSTQEACLKQCLQHANASPLSFLQAMKSKVSTPQRHSRALLDTEAIGYGGPK